MSAVVRVPLTKEGKEKIEAEIKKIKSVDRPNNIKAIEEARAHGDLSENAEYHAAKEQQAQLAARLGYLEDQLARAEVIPPITGKPDRIVFGTWFTAVDIDTEKEVKYRIVGEYESNPNEGWLSVSSPIAKAFIGKGEGDEVTVRTPGGTKSFEVLSISA